MSKRPKNVTTNENNEAVHKAVMHHRRLTVRNLAKTQEICFKSVQAILDNNLMVKKILARFVPRTFTEDQKRSREI